jgi:serine/threonine-protein kinase RsbW
MQCDQRDQSSVGRFQMTIEADPFAVRQGLRLLMAADVMQGLSEDGRGVSQIVLAEVLNNVVEHAYADGLGPIEVDVALIGDDLHCRVVDYGRPMPGGHAPDPTLTPAEELPEGGFGWYLIRTLSQRLDYRRLEGRNELCLSLSVAG